MWWLGLWLVAFPRVSFGASFVVTSNAEVAPPGLARALERAGGTVDRRLASLGALRVEADDPAFRAAAARLHGVRAVVPDVALRLVDTEPVLDGWWDQAPPSDGDPLRPYQWGLDAVGAPGAWAAGLTGAGVRVAVLDQGVDCEHPDLVANVDVASSVSFIDGEGPCNEGPSGSHGTMVAGIIAAAGNGVGIVGVAPDAQIVSVKVFSQHSAQTPFSVILEGLDATADLDVDVVSMSFSESVPLRGNDEITAADARELWRLVDRATQRLHRAGAVLVASVGNTATDLDADTDVVVLPAQAHFVLGVSGVAPTGWALDPTTPLLPTYYTSYGRSAVAFAAPGGTIGSGRQRCDMGLRCGAFDMVMTTTATGWGFGIGTSFAAPHVAGVAALFAQRLGPHAPPARIEEELYRRAAREPGRVDPYWGWGLVSTGY